VAEKQKQILRCAQDDKQGVIFFVDFGSVLPYKLITVFNFAFTTLPIPT